MKQTLRILMAIAVFSLTINASAQPTRVAIGYSGISADQLVIWVAKDTGIFAKNNLDAQPIYFSPGEPFPSPRWFQETPR